MIVGAADFEDAFTPGNNIKARCLVTPRWDDAASDEMKLERIITQKWLAVFPEGCEAWAEQRRTGYPRLFPVRYNNSRNGCVDTEKMIRRLSYPSSIFDSGNGQYEMLVDALGARIMPELPCGGYRIGIFSHIVITAREKRYKILSHKIETLSSSFRFYKC